jgi:hypothetical protein
MKILVLIILSFCSLVTTVVNADVNVNTKTLFPPMAWISKNANDLVTIQNGAGLPLVIAITVNAGKTAAGVTVKNCGTTNHVDAGSAAICSTNDANNPVSIASDTAMAIASGTYEIKQQ